MLTPTTAADLRRTSPDVHAAWAGGDLGRVGVRHVVVAELLCHAVDVHAAERVLDVAAGSGNAALAAARRSARVTAIDISADALALARRRAELEALTVHTQIADAEALPFADASFDVVLSTFGVMFARVARQAADELLRVCRPGGRIALAHWTPDGLVGGALAIVQQHAAPATAAGLGDTLNWGRRTALRRLLGERVDTLRTRRRCADLRAPSVAAHIAANRASPGPTRLVFALLEEARQAQLARELTAHAEEHNTACDGTFAAAAQYLEAVAVRRSSGAPARSRLTRDTQ